MRAPLSWIRDFTPADAPVEELVGALNQLGLEVEAVDEPGREVVGVRVARILDVLPHPDADKLQLADVDDGDVRTRVVCGAPNIYPGMLAPFAPAGARLPGGLRLDRRTIRGQVSDGMLCSPRELGLGEDHAGILDLDRDAEPGTDVREVLGLDDVVFELAVTPNRPDAMCIVGVARELAAHFGWPLDVPEPRVATDAAVGREISVVIEAPDRCPRYVGWVAAVTVGASPAWLARRLVKAGMRPISNVVDVTNYVVLERNQPLHAFDLDRLAGPGIVVRLAAAQERITTLDGVTRVLDPDDLLICDGARTPQAVAGIMGGGTSEVSDATTAILLEAAYFERMGIARSSKRLKLRSESSARFERGIDPDAVAQSAARAMELLVDVADARVAPSRVDEYPRPYSRPAIRVRTGKVNAVLGTNLGDAEVVGALAPLGIEVSGTGDDLVAVPPAFRPDLEREIDLVEEVARRVGFDAIGRTVARPRDQVGGLTRAQRERRGVVDALVGAGLSEAVTLPLVAPGDLARYGGAVDVVEVANPLRSEESVLRTMILPGLLRVAAGNCARGLIDLGLFEVGRVFRRPAEGILPDEPTHLAVVLSGARHRRPVEHDRPVDPFDALDALGMVVDALGLADVRFEPASRAGFRPGRVVGVVVDGEAAGVAGELDPTGVAEIGVAGPAVAFEVDLDRLLGAARADRSFRAPSPYPPSNVDLAFVIPAEAAAADVVRTLRRAAGGVLEAVRCFDEFTGPQVGPGRRSLAFALRFRAADHTLTDAEVADLRARCIDAVTAEHGAELRA
jgi:phenylalanyl-tRNA synthetase beta chain